MFILPFPRHQQVHVLAGVLERLILTNNKAVSERITKFSAAKPPAISLIDYLLRCAISFTATLKAMSRRGAMRRRVSGKQSGYEPNR